MAKTVLSEDEQFIVANDGNGLVSRPAGNAGLSSTVDFAFDEGSATPTQIGLTIYSLADSGGPTNEVTIDIDTPQTASAVLPGGDRTEKLSGPGSADAAAGDVTFDLADDDYGYDIAKFDTGDALDFADVGGKLNAGSNVLTDLDPSDGQKQVTAANSNTRGMGEVTLAGLTAEQDNAIFNQSSFVNEFGSGSLIL